MKLSKKQKEELFQKIFFGFMALFIGSIIFGIIGYALKNEAEEIQKRNEAIEKVSTVPNWKDQKY